jgi:hypothetical protein
MNGNARTVSLVDAGAILVVRRGVARAAVGQSGGVPVYSIRLLREGLDPIGFIEMPTSRYSEDYLIRPGDVLLSLDNPGPRNTLLVDKTMPRCTVPQQILMLRTNDRSVLDPAFLFGWISGPSFQGDLARFSHGAAMPRVALDDVLRIRIPIPPLEEQQRVGERLRTLEVAAETHRRMAAKLDLLRETELVAISTSFAPRAPSVESHE